MQEAFLEVDPFGLGAEGVPEAGGRTASSLERLAEHVVEHHARHLGRILHDEVQAGGRPLPRGQRQHVLAVEQDRSTEDLVAGLAHDDGRQRALPGTVRAHDGMDLTGSTVRSTPCRICVPATDAVRSLDLERAHDASPLVVGSRATP